MSATDTGTFALALDCMDGRTKGPVDAFMKKKFSVDYVDTPTLAGLDGVLAGKQPVVRLTLQQALDLIYDEAVISKGHGSKHAMVWGHEDCAGNKISNEDHLEDIRKGVALVRSWNLFETVTGGLVRRTSPGVYEAMEVSD